MDSNLINVKKLTNAMREAHTTLRNGNKSSILKKIDVNAPNSMQNNTSKNSTGDQIYDDKFNKILKSTVVRSKTKANAAYSNYKFSFDENSPNRATIPPPNISNNNIENTAIDNTGSAKAKGTAAATSSAWLTSFDSRMKEALERSDF